MNYVFVIINIVFIFVGAGVVCFNQRVAGLSCVGQYILEVNKIRFKFFFMKYMLYLSTKHMLYSRY